MTVLFFLFFLSSFHFAFAYDVEGTVKIEPPFPKPVEIEIPKEHAATCGTKKLSSKLQISSGGFVSNAIVELQGVSGADLKINGQGYLLDQTKCDFSPHVLLIPKGADLLIRNSESVTHNVRAFNEKPEMLFNLAMPTAGQVIRKHFDQPGHYIVRCGIHKWMHALLVVEDHPFYALTDNSGHFKISGVPDGDYTLVIWHEVLGKLTLKVNSQNSNVTIIYPAQKS